MISNLLKPDVKSYGEDNNILRECRHQVQEGFYNHYVCNLPALNENDVRMHPYKKGDRVLEKGVYKLSPESTIIPSRKN